MAASYTLPCIGVALVRTSTNVTVTLMPPAVGTQSTGTWYCAGRVIYNSEPNIETRN